MLHNYVFIILYELWEVPSKVINLLSSIILRTGINIKPSTHFREHGEWIVAMYVVTQFASEEYLVLYFVMTEVLFILICFKLKMLKIENFVVLNTCVFM